MPHSSVQFFPQPRRSAWGPDELSETVQSASPHVRFLLRELAEAETDAPARNLKSKRVAYAIVQRICNSANKDSLVLSKIDEVSGEKTYRLNPDYRSHVGELVKHAAVPPEEPAMRARKKRPPGGLQRMRRSTMPATDGVAAPSSTSPPARRLAQGARAHSFGFPRDVPLDFCQELIRFLNTSSNSTKYRMVIDGQGPKLETY